MALPHQVGLSITYDGTVKEKSTGSASSGGSGSGGTYTIVSGDTLWDLAAKWIGSGIKYTVIYEANKSVIEAAAKSHGFSSSDGGNRIWPGTVLTIPGTSTAKVITKQSISGANPKLGEKISKQATAFSYTDVASGESDSASITMYDIGKEWMGSQMPKRGAFFGAKLRLTNWTEEEKTESFNCGTFIMDDISFSGRPLSCVLGGVSVPAMDDFKSKKNTKTWESTTIKEIASEIASRAGVSLHYDAGTIQISEIEQSKQTDSAFLYSLCEKYGLAMKVYNSKIVIFDIIKYEKKAAVCTINEEDMLSWSYDTTIEGTYTGVEFSYTDPDSDETISFTVGSSGRLYEMNSQASSRYDAELQANAVVNKANRDIEKMSVTIRANPKIVASHCININGLGKTDGKYYVDKVNHSVGGSGYTMKLTLHKVQKPIGDSAGASPSSGKQYTIVYGDTLWDLAQANYGSGIKYTVIYEANKAVLEAAAKAHGYASSDGGNNIWPGTVITIPGV